MTESTIANAMDIDELERRLRTLTESEQRYRAGARYDWGRAHIPGGADGNNAADGSSEIGKCSTGHGSIGAIGNASSATGNPGNPGARPAKMGDPSRTLHQPGMPEGLGIVRNSRFNPVPEHAHDYVEISYVYQGVCPQMVNGEPLELAENEVLLLDADCPHAINALSENDVMLSLVVTRAFLRHSLNLSLPSESLVSRFLLNALNSETDHHGHVHFHTGTSRRVRRYMQEMLCEWMAPTPASSEIVLRLFQLLLAELVESYERDLLHTSSRVSPAAQAALAVGYIERHFRTCSLEDVARHLHLTPNYVSALLKRETGRTFMQLVQEYRLTRAATLLKSGACSVEETARAVGYENMSFFYRKFRARYGCPPGAYRASS